jgi:hypothetical protein
MRVSLERFHHRDIESWRLVIGDDMQDELCVLEQMVKRWEHQQDPRLEVQMIYRCEVMIAGSGWKRKQWPTGPIITVGSDERR